jgi:hypothetical protein
MRLLRVFLEENMEIKSILFLLPSLCEANDMCNVFHYLPSSSNEYRGDVREKEMVFDVSKTPNVQFTPDGSWIS